MWLLLVACVALAAVVAWLRPVLLLPVLGLLLLALLAAAIGLRRLRTTVRRILQGKRGAADASESGLATLTMPVLIMNEKAVLWYNTAFSEAIAGGADTVSLPAAKLLPGLDLAAAASPQGQDLSLESGRYTVHASGMQAEKGLYLLVLSPDTLLKEQAEEYLATRPSVLYIVIDTFDEILKEMRESDRAQIISGVDVALEKYFSGTSGFLRRVSNSRYIAIVEERHMQEMVKNRFDVLDSVRRIDEETQLVTLSIGVGRRGASFKECEEMALGALDLALGRGGDQAAVRSPDGFEFYGGTTGGVEKRSKVKSRIIAGSIKQHVGKAERVLVMGHKNSDMDSVGAAIGMLRFAKICKKPAAIVLDRPTTLAVPLVDALFDEGYADDILTPDEALQVANDRTLLIVVDTHMKHLLESPEVYNACGEVVVIDHHRRMVGHIDNAVVFYHEPYASSASELVAELLPYVGETKEDRPTPFEAEALLSGIMLDTRTFSLHVGVRTFEAAAYLRRLGAQTADVKRLFSSSMEDYRIRSQLVSEAKLVEGCAIIVSDEVPVDSEVVAPMAANDLLTIDGVDASIVAIRQGEEIRISARSMGEINVQLLMEKLGGGGHLTMAGAQLRGVSLAEAENQIISAVAQYRAEQAVAATAAKK